MNRARCHTPRSQPLLYGNGLPVPRRRSMTARTRLVIGTVLGCAVLVFQMVIKPRLRLMSGSCRCHNSPHRIPVSVRTTTASQ